MSEYFSSIIYSINGKKKKNLLFRGSEDLESLNFVLVVGEPEQPTDFPGWSVYVTTYPVTLILQRRAVRSNVNKSV